MTNNSETVAIETEIFFCKMGDMNCDVCSITLAGLYVFYSPCQHVMCFSCYKNKYGDVFVNNCCVCGTLGMLKVVCEGISNSEGYLEFLKSFEK